MSSVYILMFLVDSLNVITLYGNSIYSQTCIKKSPLGPRKRGLIRQVTFYKRFNSYDILYDRTRKR
jgi:hypothetical protein